MIDYTYATNTPRAGESAEQTAARTSLGGVMCVKDPATVLIKPAALQTQVGGAHYTYMAIQPIEYIQANRIPFPEGNVIKYVSRWRSKGGIKDLEKAKHHLELLIEYERGIGTV